MRVESTKFVIATKDFPLTFNFADGEDTDIFEEANFYDTRKDAENELEKFDEPEKRIILPVKISYEF